MILTRYGINIRIDRTFDDKTEYQSPQVYNTKSEEDNSSPKEQYEGMPKYMRDFMNEITEELGVGYDSVEQHRVRGNKDDDRSET